MARDDVTVPSASPSAAGPESGSLWARYLLVEQLGAGGMGTVWAAYDPELDRKVALKVLHDELLGRASQEQLRGEARAMARITHPNVVAVYDVGEFRGRTYYTMELVRGRSVKDWLATRRSWRDVLRVFGDAARGLAALHEAGIVHRDLKPGNLLLGDDGRARVADLGLAMVVDGVQAGTPAYMAPEQAGGGGDARSDQFAFGVSLWEALHGELPPHGSAALPRWLDAIVRKALAPAPEDRFADVAALGRALEGPARRRWPWLAAGVIAALAIAGGAWMVRDRDANPAGVCRVDGELAGVWDPPAKARIGAAVLSHPLANAAGIWREVERTVDLYIASWQDAAGAACLARVAGEPEVTSGPRATCLAQRLAEVRALGLALVGLDDDGLRAAPGMTRALSPVADCADAMHLSSIAASRDPAHAVVRAQLAAVRVARPDLVAARRALEAARVVGDSQLEAEALVEVGRAEVDADQLQAAVGTFARAAELGDPKIQLAAWTRASSALQTLGRLEEAAQLLAAAEAALKTSPDPLREAMVASVRGTLLGRQLDYISALERFNHAIALYDRAYGPSSTAQSADIRNLSIALRRLGRNSDALAALQRVLELDTAAFGPEDPDVARDLQQIGVIQSGLGNLDEAGRVLARSYAIVSARPQVRKLERAGVAGDLGVVESKRDHPNEALAVLREAVAIRSAVAPEAKETLDARGQLARLLVAMGNAAEAEPLLRAIVEARRRQLGDVHPTVALDGLVLGEALAQLGRAGEASAVLAHAREVLVAELGKAAPAVATALALAARVERAQGRAGQALRLDERAAEIRGALPPDHADRHASELALAKDHLALGDPRRALALAEAALAYFERHGPTPQIVDARFTVARAAGHDRRAIKLARSARAISAQLVTAATVVSVAELDAWLAKAAR